MALRTFVKVSGVNNLSDARYCAGMGVDQLGFNIEPQHENYTDEKAFKEISDWLSGVEFVGEIEDANSSVLSVIEGYSLNAIQVAHESQIEEANESGLPIIFKAYTIEEAVSVWSSHSTLLSYVLLESQNDLNQMVKADVPLVVQGNLSDRNIDRFLEKAEPKGIALVGGSEIRPGYNNFDELADILEVLEVDDLI